MLMSEDLMAAALNGMLQAMDEHSTYFTGKEYARFEQDLALRTEQPVVQHLDVHDALRPRQVDAGAGLRRHRGAQRKRAGGARHPGDRDRRA